MVMFFRLGAAFSLLFTCNSFAQVVSAPVAGSAQFPPYYTCTSNWYVNTTTGNDSNSGTSPTTAFKTISVGVAAALTPGACVNVAPGTYNESPTMSKGGNSQASTGYVALVSTERWGAAIVGPSSTGFSVLGINASFLVVDGFDISGGNGGNCIDAGLGGTGGQHNLIFINNHIHNCAGSGISTVATDWVTIDNNIVEDTSATNKTQTSGISLFNNTLASNYTVPAPYSSYAYHNVIRGNIVHNVVETYSCPSTPCHTDGNGIIIDSSSNYSASTLIERNLTYDNGGPGIKLFESNNVVVQYNTSYDDYTDPLQENFNSSGGVQQYEIGNLGSSNNTFIYNTAVANGTSSNSSALLDSGAFSSSFPDTNVVWEQNVAFATSGRAIIVNPPTTITAADGNATPSASPL
jgi:hypothetical protein